MNLDFLGDKNRRAAAYGLAAAVILLIVCVIYIHGFKDNETVKAADAHIPTITAVLSPQQEEKLRQAAENGDAAAQYQLGNYYHELFEATDYKNDKYRFFSAEAVKWLKKSAENGCAQAQTELGRAYYNMGSGICSLNYIEAAKWLLKAAEQNDPEAMYMIGRHYSYTGGSWYASHDFVLRHSMSKSYQWMRKAAELGYADAQYEMGELYFKNYHYLCGKHYVRGKKRLVEAEKWYKLAEKNGNSAAKDELDELQKAQETYDKSKNNPAFIEKLKNINCDGNYTIDYSETHHLDIEDFVPNYKDKYIYALDFKDFFCLDRTKLIKRLKKDAKLGHSYAQTYLAKIYEGIYSGDKNIESLPLDERIAEAEKWYAAAAESGGSNDDAKFKDFQKRKTLWDKAIMNTLSPEEEYEASQLYLTSDGLLFAYDEDKSLEWLKKSAHHRFAKAQYELGELYMSKINIDDALKGNYLSEAEKWYNVAAIHKAENADKKLEALIKLRDLAEKKAENALSPDDEYQLSLLSKAFPLLMSEKESRHHLFEAARHGSPEAMQMIMDEADRLSDMNNVRYDASCSEIASRIKKAAEYYRTAAECGSGEAQKKLEEFHRQSEEKQKKIDELSKKLADGKDDDVKYKLVCLYYNSSVPRDPEKAANMLCEMSKNGNTKALQELYWISVRYDNYERGADFDINSYRQQEAALQKEAKSGSSEALYKLGQFYYSVIDNRLFNRKQQTAAALNYWKKAATNKKNH